jgi:hypothetical protein
MGGYITRFAVRFAVQMVMNFVTAVINKTQFDMKPTTSVRILDVIKMHTFHEQESRVFLSSP